MSERFVVTEVDGYTIRPGRTKGGWTFGTSYSVIDTAACCREVGKFYTDGTPGYRRKRQAEQLAAELNRTEREYEAAQ